MDPSVLAMFIIVAVLEIIIPILIGRWAVRKYGIPWKVFGIGVLFFILIQVFHIILVSATQPALGFFLTTHGVSQGVTMIILAIFLGLLAGIFEEPGRWVVFTRYFKKKRIKLSRENALVFGLGWAAIESIMVAVILLLTMFSYMAAVPLTDQDLQDLNATYGGILTGEQLDSIQAQNEALMALGPLDLIPGLLERFFVIAIQLGFTFLVFYSVLLGRKSLLAVAILWHAFVDATAVIMAYNYGAWPTEFAILVFAIISLLYVRKKMKK